MAKKHLGVEAPLRVFQALIKHPRPMGRPFLYNWLDIKARNRVDAEEKAASEARSYSAGGWTVVKVQEVKAAAQPPVNSQILRELNSTLDASNFAILEQRANMYAARPGPYVGDFVEMPNGELLRLIHEGGDKVQATSSASSACDFYLGRYQVSFSGGPQSSVKKSALRLTSATRTGEFRFFRDDNALADLIVVTIPCRKWRLRP